MESSEGATGDSSLDDDNLDAHTDADALPVHSDLHHHHDDDGAQVYGDAAVPFGRGLRGGFGTYSHSFHQCTSALCFRVLTRRLVVARFDFERAAYVRCKCENATDDSDKQFPRAMRHATDDSDATKATYYRV